MHVQCYSYILHIQGWYTCILSGSSSYSIGIYYCKRFAQSAGPGSQKAWIWELCFAMGVLFGVFVGWFFDHWKHFVSAGGPTFDGSIRFGRPKGPHEAPTRNPLIFWTDLGVTFWICCFYFLASVFKHRFLLSSGTVVSCMYVGFILAHFWIFLLS